MDWYRGKTILITGGSGGIGAEMARILARYGVTLLLTARSQDQLEAVADECYRAGSEAHIYVADLGKHEGATELFNRISEDKREIDILINNAGYGKIGDFVDHEAEVYADMITLHVETLTVLSRLVLPAMLSRNSGGIMNVASTAAFQPMPRFNVYAATKSYITSFSQALHAEMKSTGIHVSCLAPGPTKTSFFARADSKKLPPSAPPAETRDVALRGLIGLAKNKRLVVPGVMNQIGAFAPRLAPTSLVMAVARQMMRRTE